MGERGGTRVRRLAPLDHDELGERVARAAGRGRAIDLDRDGGQAGVDIGPGARVVRTAAGTRGQRFVDVGGAQLQPLSAMRLRKGDAIDADLDFQQFARAVAGAGGIFAGLHPARGIDEVGVPGADPGTEQLHAGTGAGRFDHRGPGIRIVGDEAFGDDGCKRIDGGRPDRRDLVTRARTTAIGLILASRQRERRGDEAGDAHEGPWGSPDGANLSLPPLGNPCVTLRLPFCDSAFLGGRASSFFCGPTRDQVPRRRSWRCHAGRAGTCAFGASARATRLVPSARAGAR